MAKKNRLTIDFEGFDILQKQLQALGGDTRQAVDDALKDSQQLVARKVSAAMIPHTRPTGGETKGAIITNKPVEWAGDTAAVGVGFDIADGGLPSIFLMYGTQLHGQPHITPDKNLYNAVYGTQTRKEIRKIQEEAYRKAIERAMSK